MPTIYFTGSASDNYAFKANSSKTYYLYGSESLPANCIVTGATFYLSKVYSYSDYYTFDVLNANGDKIGDEFCGDASSKNSNVATDFTWDMRNGSTYTDRYRYLDSITLEGNGSTTANLMSIRSGCDIEIAVTYQEYIKPTLNSGYPVDTTVMPGASTTLQVKVSSAGYPTSLSYQWYKNGVAVSGATGATLTVTPTGTEKYYCVVSNSAGSTTSRTATISRYSTPVLNNTLPADVSIIPGNSTTLSVAISTAGNPASYTYQWYKNGVAISGATSASVSVSEAGSYYCKVTNTAGTVTSRTATVSQSSGGAIWVNGVKKAATAYVYHNGAWCVATPHCYSEGSYKPCSSG